MNVSVGNQNILSGLLMKCDIGADDSVSCSRRRTTVDGIEISGKKELTDSRTYYINVLKQVPGANAYVGYVDIVKASCLSLLGPQVVREMIHCTEDSSTETLECKTIGGAL